MTDSCKLGAPKKLPQPLQHTAAQEAVSGCSIPPWPVAGPWDSLSAPLFPPQPAQGLPSSPMGNSESGPSAALPWARHEGQDDCGVMGVWSKRRCGTCCSRRAPWTCLLGFDPSLPPTLMSSGDVCSLTLGFAGCCNLCLSFPLPIHSHMRCLPVPLHTACVITDREDRGKGRLEALNMGGPRSSWFRKTTMRRMGQ